MVAFGGRVFGLEPSSGAVIWENPMGTHGDVEILIHRGRVYATDGLSLRCFDYRTGASFGGTEIPDQYPGRPSMVIERDQIFIGSEGEVTCFDLNGQRLWSQGFKGKGVGRVTLGFPGNVRQADDIGSR